MATTNSITSTYVGKDSKEFISPVLNSGRTLGAGGVTIKKNVNYKTRITKIALSGLIAGATCDFTPSGTVTQTESWLNVMELEVNMELCKSDYYEDFIGEDMFPGSALNAGFLKYLLQEIGAHVADAMETMIWQGVTGANAFNGFETQFAADGSVIKTVTPVAITNANVIAEARRVIAGITATKPALIGKSDARLYVGAVVFQALREAYNDKNSAKPQGEVVLQVDGIDIFYAPGLQSGSMALAQISNLWFGTWENSTLAKVGVLDMTAIDFSNNIRFGMGYFAGVAYGQGDEIVYYASV